MNDSPLPFDWDAAVRHLTESDATLGRLIARVGPLRLRLRPAESTFAALLESVVYQQLAGAAAATILGRVQALFPARLPTPSALLGLSDAALRAAGLSRSKAASLKDLARRAADGALPALSELSRFSDADLIERLSQARGVGPWTVHMLLIFRLGRPDVLPVGDFAVRKACGLLYRRGRFPTPSQLEWRARPWRPYRSVAAWYLWRLFELPEAEWKNLGPPPRKPR